MTFNSKKLTLIIGAIGTTVMIIAGMLILPKEQESTSTASSKQEVATTNEMKTLNVEQKDTVDIQPTHHTPRKSQQTQENRLVANEIRAIEEEKNEEAQEEKNPTIPKPHYLHKPSPKEREAMLLRRIAHEDREKKIKMMREKLHAKDEEKRNND